MQVRQAKGAGDMARAQALRHLCFRAARGQTGPEADRFDPLCQHYLIEDAAGGLLATFRVLLFSDGKAISQSYAAQFYDLTRLASYPAAMLELGRFCLHPAAERPADVLRLAWAALTAIVDGHGVQMLFGCTSFDGADPARHAAALSLLRSYLAPAAWSPHRRAGALGLPEGASGPAPLPPLLRSYLAMGGWVSDHAVTDPDLDTLHVFTALEVARIPAARAAALRALAKDALAGQG